MWRHIQKSGLMTKYGVDKDFNINMRALKALAFLRPEEMRKQIKPSNGLAMIMW